MQDGTNHIINLGKSLESRNFFLKLSYNELYALKFLAENYRDDGTIMMDFCSNTSAKIKEILDFTEDLPPISKL